MENPFKREYYRNIPEASITQYYRNPRIKLPFDPKDLVMFLDRQAAGSPEDLSRRLRTIPYHHRSADLGITTPIHEHFPSRGGESGVHHVYTQIDIKGGGFVHPEKHESRKHGQALGYFTGSPEAVFMPASLETATGYDVMGLLDVGAVQTTADNARKLASKGMRTEAVAGIYEINMIRIDGTDVPAKEFAKQALEILFQQADEARRRHDRDKLKIINEKIKTLKSPDGFRPAIEVRCMRNVLRLRDLKDASAKQRRRMIEEAVNCLNIEMQYLGSDVRFDAATPEGRKKWLEFVVFWIGKNAGIMHKEGIAHVFLHMGNLTLAGEAVDLDSAQNVVKTGKGSGKEYEDEPFFTRSGEGYAYISPDIQGHRWPDQRFSLPKCLIKDMRDSCFSFRTLLKGSPELKAEVSTNDLADKMVQGYLEGLGASEPFVSIGVTREKLISVMREIAQEIIGKDVFYAPIPTDDLE